MPLTAPPVTPRRATRQRIAVIIGILVSAIFLVLAFQGLQPEAFLRSLTSVDVPLLLIGGALYAIPVWLIGWRWQFLLNVIQHVPVWGLTRIASIGYMGNNVYPLRAGEVLRVYLLKRDYHITMASSATTILVERIFDGIVMLSFVGIGILAGGVESEEIRLVVSIATPFFVIGLLLFLLIAQFPQLARFFIRMAERILPARIAGIVHDLSEQVLAGLASLRTPLDLFGVIFTSYASRFVEALIYWLVMMAMSIDLSFPVALLVMGVVNLAGLLPTSPGQIGVFEFFASRILIAYGTPDDTALAYAIVVHIVIWLPVTVAGFVFLAQKGLSWRAVTHEIET